MVRCVIGDATGVSVRATVELQSQFLLQQDSHSLCMSLLTALVIVTVSSRVTRCCVIDVAVYYILLRLYTACHE